MRVLFASSEAAPFIKSGGLGDVAGALPKALVKAGVDVRVILPYYQDIKPQLCQDMTYVGNIYVPLAWRRQYCGIFTKTVDGVRYYFVDNEYYFKRKGIYGHYDDAERFSFFSRAILESMKITGFYPDIVHCNDWQTGLVPVYLDAYYRHDKEYSQMRTLFTIHNIEFQGKYGKDVLADVVGLPEDKNALIDYAECVNYMKGAIESANVVSTVSNSYATEILDSYYAYGLEDILIDRQYKLKGIVNGIDVDSYNPSTDKCLFACYDAMDFTPKATCKQQLLRMLDMPEVEGRPLVAMITRLTNQKGIDLVLEVIEEILSRDLQMVVLGTGDWAYEASLRDVEKKYPSKFKALITFSEDLARKIYSGADMFLMPSRFEPCGLSQLIAMRYGNVPIVRETGGLKDTVAPYIVGEGEGTGFTFYSYNAHDMLGAIDRAIEVYTQPLEWQKVVRNCMEKDYSWTASATKYHQLYQQILN
ncbi:MAG: glycogen synthase GlgA [Clostridia bacterium]|nr:glycogen synthase GlgA [Clostridia bacterium]